MTGSWWADARCRTVGPDVMVHDAERGVAAAYDAQAKKVCAACRVRAECLAFALEMEAGYSTPFRAGVYGGLTARERYALDRRARKAAA